MSVNGSRRGFLLAGAAAALTLIVGGRAVAQDRAGRRITVYKSPT